jgi:hypothetical protein
MHKCRTQGPALPFVDDDWPSSTPSLSLRKAVVGDRQQGVNSSHMVTRFPWSSELTPKGWTVNDYAALIPVRYSTGLSPPSFSLIRS